MATNTMTETLVLEPTMHMKLGNGGISNTSGGKLTNNALRMRNLKLDPARALEPARKKLSTIEAQRIMAVFEETIKRAEIVTALPYIMDNSERFHVSFGSELIETIKQHARIQGSYKEIRLQLENLLKKRAKQLEKIERKHFQEMSAAMKEQEQDSVPDEQEYTETGEGSDSLIKYTLEEEAQEGTEAPDMTLASSENTAEEETNGSKHDNETSKKSSDLVAKSSKASLPQNAEGSRYVNISEGAKEEATNVDPETGSSNRPQSSSSSSASDYDPRIQEAMRNLGLVAQQVSHSCKNILRQFSVNPTAMKAVVSSNVHRDQGSQSIIDHLKELRDIVMHKLLTTPEEEAERMAYLEDISKRERHNAAIIEKQEKELKEAIDDKDEEIRKKNEVIKRLQTDLHQIEKFSDENIRRTRAEAEKQEIADVKNSDQKTQKLQAEINHLQTQLNNAISEHREIEADLRAKKYKVENEVDNWIQKYDQDMGERQDEYEEIELVYTEEKKQLLELEERFATLEKEYMAIMEERRVAREKRERAQRELALLVKAATTIQAFWRSYKVRKALKAKSKKKGGKKGK